MSEVKTRAERIALKVRRKQRLVRVALGEEKADVVLKNADYVNVFSGTIEHGDIAVANGLVVGMADHYDGLMEVDVSGKIVAPGFIDAHIHLESSLAGGNDELCGRDDGRPRDDGENRRFTGASQED